MMKPFMEMKIPTSPLRGPPGTYLQGLTHFIFVCLGFLDSKTYLDNFFSVTQILNDWPPAKMYLI